MTRLILFILIACSTIFYAQKLPLRKTLKGERFVGLFRGNDSYLTGKLGSETISYLVGAKYEYFLSNKSSIAASIGSDIDNLESTRWHFSGYSTSIAFNQRIASGIFLGEGFYSYAGIKGSYRKVILRNRSYTDINDNIILGGIHTGALLLILDYALHLELGVLFPKGYQYGNNIFSYNFGISYKI